MLKLFLITWKIFYYKCFIYHNLLIDYCTFTLLITVFLAKVEDTGNKGVKDNTNLNENTSGKH